ncbi:MULTISPECIES: tyrosine phosphatase family protein [Phenylobacterium]|uniref:Protein tyrosine phosphatase n=1 Tax=Phenylobacterium koreense TaxID=266125 RepID=A0ABV2EE11_9CAUL
MTLIVCGLAEVPALIASRAPSHMITLLDAASMIETPRNFAADRHLRISVNDIAEPTDGLVLPSEAMVERLIAFGRGWDASAPMIVHCWAGISRSSASAFVLACDRNPHADEMTIAMGMRRAAKHAYPNRRIVAIADDVLGRRGRMVDAVEAMGDYEYSGVGAPFDLAASY